MENNVGSILTKRTYLNPDSEALFDVAQSRRFTYEELNARTNQVAHGLLSLGVGKGDTVWTSPITFVASANCALFCGASIDFVDIELYDSNQA